MDPQKYCVWMITGGTTHALCCLSACIKYAIRSGRLILPFSETHPNFGQPFYNFYQLNQHSRFSQYFVEEENYADVRNHYTAPYIEMPSKLTESVIDGPLPDSSGKQRYFLRDLYSSETNERYLDYPQIGNEFKKYIMTWGRHDYYWQKQLEIVLETLNPSNQLGMKINQSLHILNNQLNTRSYIGVHFRNTDYKSNLQQTLDKAISAAHQSGIQTIFWATDDSSSYAYAEAMLTQHGLSFVKSKDLIDSQKIGSINVHSIKEEDLKTMGTSKIDQIAIFFSEVLILSQSSLFIPTSGTVPFLVKSIKKSKNWQILLNKNSEHMQVI